MSGHVEKVGHRGAPREFPANTLRGFQRAQELGCTMVECDVRQAADGVLVLAHDPTVTDRNGQVYTIAEQTSATLQALDLGAGEGVPPLTELADWARGKCAVMADMKCEGGDIEPRVVAALKGLAIGEKIVPGAGEESRRRFQERDPSLPLSLSLDASARALIESDGFAQRLNNWKVQAVTWQYPLLDAPRIAWLHDLGLRVYAWTVDDLPTMQRLLSDGVDGIISNRPDLLAAR